MRDECDGCGLSAGDLPDEVDPDVFFEPVGGRVLCQGCASTAASGGELISGEFFCSECEQVGAHATDCSWF